MSRTRVYLLPLSLGGRKGGFGLGAAWCNELVRMLSRETSIRDTSRTLSSTSASLLDRISKTKVRSDSKPQFRDDGADEFDDGGVVLGDEVHLVLVVPDLPAVLVEAQRVVDVELRGHGVLLPIDDLHQDLAQGIATSRIIRLFVWM